MKENKPWELRKKNGGKEERKRESIEERIKLQKQGCKLIKMRIKQKKRKTSEKKIKKKHERI